MTSEGPAAADVAIVGGGFSGTMVAAQLSRRGISSIIIDGGGRMGRGIAYSTREPAHVLNVRAEVMSAWPDEPDHFARAVEAEGGTAKDFSQRRRFGRYLESILDEAVDTGLVTTVEARAVTAHRDGPRWVVGLEQGGAAKARALVLAVGNQEPSPMRVGEGIPADRFINNPWGSAARDAVERLVATGGPALLIGTGLTAVDLILSLDANGHQGPVVALSRRGQMPRGHLPYESAPVDAADVPMGNVLALWRWLRRRASQVGWRAAVDSLRPHTSSIWQAFSLSEQRRFLRHARPWWDVHRHRIATEVAERIRDLIGSGSLEVTAGRIKAIREVPDGVDVDIARRGSSSITTRRFAAVFNCTGPLGTFQRTGDPILRQMLADKLIEQDGLGMGVAVDGNDRAGERMWAMGPMTKGRYWEIIAVPDIRIQAAQVAADIATELGR